jgi:ketosteroid isomerase-like protein
MSQEPEKLVRAAVAAWNSGGPAAFVGLTSDDIALEDPSEMPDRGRWIGRTAVTQRLDEVSRGTGGRWIEIEDVRAVGDRVLALLDWRRGDSADAPPLASLCLLIEVRLEKISCVRVFLDERAAIQAASAREVRQAGSRR